jgi:hypothetical protein
LADEEVMSTNSPVEKELLLSGLVGNWQGVLRVNNRIYGAIFDRRWVDRVINEKHDRDRSQTMH